MNQDVHLEYPEVAEMKNRIGIAVIALINRQKAI